MYDRALWGTNQSSQARWGNFRWGELFIYTPIASEVLRSLIWTNISWSNVSTAICNRSTVRIMNVIDPEALAPRDPLFQLHFEPVSPSGGAEIDSGATFDYTTVDAHVFCRPSASNRSNFGIYLRDREHLVEEVKRVVRVNRTNASGYESIAVPPGGIVYADIIGKPEVDPPILETIVKVRFNKVRDQNT